MFCVQESKIFFTDDSECSGDEVNEQGEQQFLK